MLTKEKPDRREARVFDGNNKEFWSKKETSIEAADNESAEPSTKKKSFQRKVWVKGITNKKLGTNDTS